MLRALGTVRRHSITQSCLAWTRGLASAAPQASSSDPDRERLEFDVCIVGGGPAGLSAAIKLKQLCKEKNRELNVCVIDKGAEIGSHILSGAVIETRALDELLPDWKDDPDAPIKVKSLKDKFYWLYSSAGALRIPGPPGNHKKGNYVVSLSEVCRWMAKKAEDLGVEILPGFSGRNMIYDWNNRVLGVATNDFGLAKDGVGRREGYTPGVDLIARATLLAEGCRGSLAESVIDRYKLRKDSECRHQSYALGLKEVWEVPAGNHKPGTVIHTVGFPLDHSTYGGGFIYHMADNKVALGLVIGLDYSNPHLNTYQEFQRWKLHPMVKKHIEGGTCLQYGARTLNEGGFQSIPQLHFPGGALIGCSAGFLNVAKIKGTHTAMLSGMMGGEAAFRALTGEGDEKGREFHMAEPEEQERILAEDERKRRGPADMSRFGVALERSWLWEELKAARNVRPSFKWGLIPGMIYSALELFILRGHAPWTLLPSAPDHKHLKPASSFSPIEYPKPDGKITFDLPTSLYRSGTNHDHNQPSHLKLKDSGLSELVNDKIYAAPETRFCPAGVFEYTSDEHGRRRLGINAQNCLHCKTCDIKDPEQNIKYHVPEGGGGPNYTIM